MNPAVESQTPPGRRLCLAGICLALVILVAIVFGQTARYGFLMLDDRMYVVENSAVLKGVTLSGIGWAFTHIVSQHWHPLTIISLMLDHQFFGLWAGGYHIVNVAIHAACAVLLFLLLLEMTGAPWRCAFVAALFAIHPLRAESVAWISERKDVLSGLFFMLTLWAYVRYVKGGRTRGRYAMVALWFALGLMSKPMLVTVPCVLLILDYWPLGRLRSFSQFPRLFLEKVPLFVLTALSSLAATLALTSGHPPVSSYPGSAPIAYVVYLGKLFYPVHLAALYPFPRDGYSFWQVFDAILLLVSLTTGIWFLRRGHPYLLAGWLWFLGMLVPVIGLMQTGSQPYADRYTYLPAIGLCIGVTWLAADWAGIRQFRRTLLGAAAGVILVVLMIAAWRQVGYWRDTTALCTRSLACTTDNWDAHFTLGNEYRFEGRIDDAIAQFRDTVEIDPGNAVAHNNLGASLIRQGHVDDAVEQYRAAVRLRPTDAMFRYDLAGGLLRQTNFDEAISQFREAMHIDPHIPTIHDRLAFALMLEGRTTDGIAEYRQALEDDPDDAEAHEDLGMTLFQQGDTQEAIAHLEKGLALEPGSPNVQNALAWILATAPQAALRDGPRAIQFATQASAAADNQNPIFLRTMAAAYAQTGDFSKAQLTARRAFSLAAAQSNRSLAEALVGDFQLYQSGRKIEDGH